MSDQDKDLLKAEMDAIPNAYRAFYCWHIIENIKKKVWSKGTTYFLEVGIYSNI